MELLKGLSMKSRDEIEKAIETGTEKLNNCLARKSKLDNSKDIIKDQDYYSCYIANDREIAKHREYLKTLKWVLNLDE